MTHEPLHSHICLLSFLVKYTRRNIGPSLTKFGQVTFNLSKILWTFPILRETTFETTVSQEGPGDWPHFGEGICVHDLGVADEERHVQAARTHPRMNRGPERVSAQQKR